MVHIQFFLATTSSEQLYSIVSQRNKYFRATFCCQKKKWLGGSNLCSASSSLSFWWLCWLASWQKLDHSIFWKQIVPALLGTRSCLMCGLLDPSNNRVQVRVMETSSRTPEHSEELRKDLALVATDTS